MPSGFVRSSASDASGGFRVPNELYDQAIGYMEGTVHDLARRVPTPRLVQGVDLRLFRYTERTLEQAIVRNSLAM